MASHWEEREYSRVVFGTIIRDKNSPSRMYVFVNYGTLIPINTGMKWPSDVIEAPDMEVEQLIVDDLFQTEGSVIKLARILAGIEEPIG